MNFKKGIYRLSIIAAVVVGLIGFALGWIIYLEEKTTGMTITMTGHSPPSEAEVKEAFKAAIKRGNGAPKPGPWQKYEASRQVTPIPRVEQPESRWVFEDGQIEVLSLQEAFALRLEEEIQEYVFTSRITPPLYKTLGVATLSATLSFFVTLLGIRGFTLLGIWIVGGFREQ